MKNKQVPEGWASCVITDIAEVNPKKIEAASSLIAGFVPMALAPVAYGEPLAFEQKVWGSINKSYTNFKNNDVVFAKVTPCFENGKAAIAKDLPNGIAAGSSEFYVLRPHKGYILPELLLALIKTQKFSSEGAENMTGAVGLRRVPKKFVETYSLQLPPLAEQQQIADTLDRLLAQVASSKAELEAALVSLKQFRQSVLAAAVSGELTKEWREGKKVVVAWEKKLLSQITDSVSDGDHQAPPRAENGIPFLVISNVSSGKIEFDNVSRWVPENYFNELKDIRVPKQGDLLYTVTGSYGIPVKVETKDKFCFQRHIAIIKPNASSVNNSYLFYTLGSQYVLQQAHDLATGTAQKTVSLKSLRGFEIPVPSLDEQAEIVSRVEALFAAAEQAEAETQAALDKVNNLTQSILARAFSGELTASWREQTLLNTPELLTGDNSAANLLLKIKAEREAKLLAEKEAKKAARAAAKKK